MWLHVDNIEWRGSRLVQTQHHRRIRAQPNHTGAVLNIDLVSRPRPHTHTHTHTHTYTDFVSPKSVVWSYCIGDWVANWLFRVCSRGAESADLVIAKGFRNEECTLPSPPNWDVGSNVMPSHNTCFPIPSPIHSFSPNTPNTFYLTKYILLGFYPNTIPLFLYPIPSPTQYNSPIGFYPSRGIECIG